MTRRTYLDHNASTPLDPGVAEAVAKVQTDAFGNASSTHTEGRKARNLLEDARERVAGVLGCKAREIVFTSGGTEALNLAVRGAAHARVDFGRRVVVTAIEHAAVLDAADSLVAEGFEVARVAPTSDGRIDPEAMLAACGKGTTVACMMLANHETGALLPVASVARELKAKGTALVCDAALGPGMLDVRVDALGVDLLALSAHKWNGPKGIGALYVRRRTKLEPQQHGGVQEERIRGGTENVAGAVGLAEALERADSAKVQRTARYGAFTQRLLRGVSAIPGCRLVGPVEQRLPNTANLELEGCEGEAVLVNLDLAGIAVSTGSACAVGGTEASPVLLAMGMPARRAATTIRVSFGEGNDDADVANMLSILPSVVARLRGLAR